MSSVSSVSGRLLAVSELAFGIVVGGNRKMAAAMAAVKFYDAVVAVAVAVDVGELETSPPAPSPMLWRGGAKT
jgi:hypothetical protein